MLQIKDLSYEIDGHRILEHINITFEAGQTYGIIGPNGAGKSTVLKHIMRIIEPSAGTIFYEGKDVRSFKIKDYAKKMSFVFQENVRQVDFTVYEILLMGRYVSMDLWGNVSDKDEALIHEIIEDLGIAHLKNRAISTLSGGEAQKVFIGRALVQNAPLLLLDEPTSMLDIHNGLELIELIETLKVKHHLTVIMVLHDLNLAFNYCNRIILIEKGQVISMGSSNEIFKEPKLREVYHHKLHQIMDEEACYIVPRIKRAITS
ncbi:MAG: ABC transporter ATP-binding protein [Cellulosilyticaceae bacterium]